MTAHQIERPLEQSRGLFLCLDKLAGLAAHGGRRNRRRCMSWRMAPARQIARAAATLKAARLTLRHRHMRSAFSLAAGSIGTRALMGD
ncbi:hypothetical protein [Lysobacter gummosus]|uniref:hypothetical protein n=1 Tax=Lysobacter gummosus TaxID=262324 RepID=UPI003635C610